MRLTLKNISTFLMEKGLLKPKSIVDGDYMVTQTQNRNAIFKIHIKNDKSLFVKQLVSFDPQNSYYLQKDATCMWLIKNENAFKELSQYVPDYYGYDPEKQVLIVEYIPEAKNLEELYQEEKGASLEIYDRIAKILSSFHFKLDEKTLTNRSVQFFMRQLPWTFQIASSGSNYLQQNAAFFGTNPVVNYLKSNEVFFNLMRQVVPKYEFTSLIHGDIKWVNFILQSKEDINTLKIIDWELADIGDPIWDLAGVMQTLMTSKIMMNHSVPAFTGTATALTQQQMIQSIEEIRQLWNAYATYRNFDAKDQDQLLNKAIEFTGMRLIQTAFESNMSSQQILPMTSHILQLSISLLQNADNMVQQIIHSQKATYEHI